MWCLDISATLSRRRLASFTAVIPTTSGRPTEFIATGHLPTGPDPIGYAEIAPDLVVEVISPSDTATDVQECINDWLRSGTTIVWAAYSSLQEVVVWRGLGIAERKSGDQELDAEPIIPGFRCKVSALVAD
jgi:Uma2 family endonuclease